MKDKPVFDQESLRKLLRNQNYKKFPDDPFEPSSDKPIDKNNLTLKKLIDYHYKNYGAGSKPEFHLEAIVKIINIPHADMLIKRNRSEYFKLLTHFAILSKAKQGWFHLLVTHPTKTWKSSLSDNPSRLTLKQEKKLNDAIIRCFYNRLIQGMTENEKECYSILLPHDVLPTRFDKLLHKLDKTIQDLFWSLQKNIEGYQDETSLPDMGLDEAISLTRFVLHQFFNKYPKKGYISDTLRGTLLKFATLNRAINDVDAIFDIHNKVIDSLPNEIQQLKHIKSESEIQPNLLGMFNQKKLPKGLIECAKLVCKMYIITSVPYETTDESLNQFNEIHMEPNCIAVSAALLYHDFLRKEKFELNIRGEKNRFIPIYKTLSSLSKKVVDIHLLTTDILWHYGFPEDLFKYLTTRYSISVFGLSDAYSSQIGAAAHLKVKIKKFELQKEAYEQLKEMSVEDVCLCISHFCYSVYQGIETMENSLEDSNA